MMTIDLPSGEMCGNQSLKLVVLRDLLLLAAVGPHPPDLHPPGARRVEVDPLPVRRVLRPIVDALRVGEAHFLAAVDGDLVDVELAVALTPV